ncbi:MAG: aminoglycoside phosphotransferase, partial [Glaciihabitans sp.]|nr:aminoglycoside phosphotransferase [Glaciihabitans sp.]
DAALDSITALPHIRGRQPPALPEASALLAEESDGWVKLTADSTGADLPRWVLQNVARLTASARRAGDAVQGDHLVHLDCRVDNVLVDAQGRAWLVDWPWACIGAPWLDGLSLLLDARLRGGTLDTDRVLREHPLFTDVPTSSIDAVLSALAGSFFHKARLPAPPNLPTLRAFQRSEVIAAARWLRQRWSEAAKPGTNLRG